MRRTGCKYRDGDRFVLKRDICYPQFLKGTPVVIEGSVAMGKRKRVTLRNMNGDLVAGVSAKYLGRRLSAF